MSTLSSPMGKSERAGADGEPNLRYRGLKAMPFIIGNETFEKLGTVGTSSNLLVYLTAVFNMKSITAVTLINIFYGTTNLGTLVGAFLSDTYFGRYKTLAFATVASFMGMLVITLTAVISKLHPPHCGIEQSDTCIGPTPWQMVFLLLGFGLLVIGASGIRPCNLVFGADQFNPTTESGKRGLNSFFNWWYFTGTVAMMIALTIVIYVQSEVNWALGLAIPTFLMLLACVLFLMGAGIYVKVEPKGSPLKSVVQVMVAAARKRKLKLPEQPRLTLFSYVSSNSINSKLPYTDQFRFLDKGSIITPEDQINPEGSATNSWRLCSIQQVEEVKCLMRVIPIWASAIIYYTALAQQQTFTVFQALQSNRQLGHSSFKIPAASFSIFSMLGLIIWIPIYDQVMVPLLKRLTGKEGGITVLQKMGVGMFLSIVAMLVSAFVEQQRRAFAFSELNSGNGTRRGLISPMSGLRLIPQLTLVGVSEAFTVIAQVEFFYKQFPESMRSIGGSFSFLGVAVSSYLSSFLVSTVHRMTARAATGNWLPEDLNKGRLDYFYYLVAALGVINLCYFILCAKWYKYKENACITPEVHMGRVESEKHLA